MQVEKLKSHGMSIDDEFFAIHILEEVNYYRFTGYALQFRASTNDSNFIRETTFKQVLSIYRFDEAFRNILRQYLEKVEIYYRTLIAYHFSMAKCVCPPYDQHYNKDNFCNKKGYEELREHFHRNRGYYRDSMILKHHIKNYDDRLPLWAIVELISFSDLSKLYNCMFLSEKNLIANAANTDCATLTNNLHCLSVLRNKCAHAARLYNTKYNPPACLSLNFLRKYRQVKNDTLFAYVVVLIKRLPDKDLKDCFRKDIIHLIDDYSASIELSLIGFPSNWRNILASSC